MGECLKEAYKERERLLREILLNEEYNSKIPKISVIMSVYNTKEEWLREAIESILNQTYKNFEFIIINDGSTNNVEDVIKSYTDKRIIYTYQKNQGLANSLNNALNIAKGEYIARMDSDDISLPTRFEKQLIYFKKNTQVSVLGTLYELMSDKSFIYHPQNVKFLDLLKGCYIAHPTVMWKRKDFENFNLKYNPEYKCEDYELWSRAIRYLKFANLQEVLLKYRIHDNNLSKPTNEFMSHDKKVKENMLNFLTDNAEVQDKILDIIFPIKNSFFENIFSIKNSWNKKYKIITILGLKIKIRRGI